MYMKEEEEEEEDNSMKYMKQDEGREEEATPAQFPQLEPQHQYWADQIFSMNDKNMNCLVPYTLCIVEYDLHSKYIYLSVWITTILEIKQNYNVLLSIQIDDSEVIGEFYHHNSLVNNNRYQAGTELNHNKPE